MDVYGRKRNIFFNLKIHVSRIHRSAKNFVCVQKTCETVYWGNKKVTNGCRSHLKHSKSLSYEDKIGNHESGKMLVSQIC